jgi:hypothetical protein
VAEINHFRNLFVMKILFMLTAFILLVIARTEAMDISAVGSWSGTIDAAALQAGAGSNLTDTYESVAGATVLTIFNTASNSDNWRVDVRRTDAAWHSNFHLYVKRTSDGTGSGSISGGSSYLEIPTIDSQFFSGAGNRDGINLRYILTGMSVSASPNVYGSTVIFTVVDTL